MNSLVLEEVANSVMNLQMYPNFDVAHYILMSLTIRDDTHQSGTSHFSRKHPFACWFSTMLMCFGGSILSNFVIGDPLFPCFDDHRSVLTATAVWYFVNYSPFDIVYRICGSFSIRLIIAALKEVHRTNKIYSGTMQAYSSYPNSAFTCILSGLLRGSGSCFMRTFASVVYGNWQPKLIEFLEPSFVTKISTMAAAIFYYQKIDLIQLQGNILFLTVVSFLVYLRIVMFLFVLKDPLAPLEQLCCTIFFGRTVDAQPTCISRRLRKLVAGDRAPSSPKKDHVSSSLKSKPSSVFAPNEISNNSSTNDKSKSEKLHLEKKIS